MQVTAKEDAQNRAVRSFVQGFAIDIGAAVVIALTTILVDANGWGDLQWALVGFSFFKSVMQAALAYVMRTVFRNAIPPVTSGQN